MQTRNNKLQAIILGAIMVTIIIAACVIYRENPISYSMFTNDAISYEKARVVKILKNDVIKNESTKNRYIGTQEIQVRFSDGQNKGDSIILTNSVTTTHNIYVTEGQRVVIKADRPDNAEPYYTVYNYDRTPGIILIIVIFVLLMALVGKTKGIKSVAGLAFILLFICIFLIPMIYQGYSPILMCILTVILTVTTSMFLLNGFSKKTLVSIISAITGVVISAVFFAIFSKVLHLTGYNLEDAEELILIQQNTGLQIEQLLFIGVLIASLGAIMDMTISVASPLFEMKKYKKEMTVKELFRSGMDMGSDMIGTMCETLILAFSGTGITTLLVVVSYGTQIDQFLSSDYIVIEIAHSLTGAVAVILTVPLTSLLCALTAGKTVKEQ